MNEDYDAWHSLRGSS